ncbi:MAG: hypothetical protein ACR2MA_04215 [Egibacteraceae bacterium]
METLTGWERLTDADLALLARNVEELRHDVGASVNRLRVRPELIDEVLARPEIATAVLGGAGSRQRPSDDPPMSDRALRDPLLRASPLLVFGVAVHAAAADIVQARYVAEWAGVRQRLPVFTDPELTAFAADPVRLSLLASLLASYTRVASGSVWVQTARGPRRRRYSELDLLRLASMLDAVPAPALPDLYRRLGDLALFLSGVFPDATAARGFRPLDLQRLAAAIELHDAGSERLAEALAVRGAVGLLEQLGARWYRLALQRRPQEPQVSAVATTTEQFTQARRLLNHVTDAHLFGFRAQWFPGAA